MKQMITSAKVKELIQTQLQSEHDLTNVHGVDITKSLIEPFKQDYKSDNGEIIELWTVLREYESHGYSIFYDQEDNMFGLGMISNEGMHNIGYHGTFLDALKGM